MYNLMYPRKIGMQKSYYVSTFNCINWVAKLVIWVLILENVSPLYITIKILIL